MHVISVLVLTTEYKHKNFASIKKKSLKSSNHSLLNFYQRLLEDRALPSFFFEAILISTQTLRQTHQLLLKKKKSPSFAQENNLQV